jgi:hypothetical protein
MVAYRVMNRATILKLIGIVCLPALSWAAVDEFVPPDSVVLKDGRTLNGLIVKNTKEAIFLQMQTEELELPKADIVRIVDRADDDSLYTRVPARGELPSWRVIANDLRTNDAIRSMVEIPATRIERGVLRNVPYKSFRVNEDLELNVYGNPEKPAALEMGIYGVRRNAMHLRRSIRAYLAGFLTSREEISKLYRLDLRGGETQCERMTVKISPPDGEDSYGAWWILVYNPKQLAAARVSDQAYARVTRPFEEVVNRRGRIQDRLWMDLQASVIESAHDVGRSTRDIFRGFRRTEDGKFQILGVPVGG